MFASPRHVASRREWNWLEIEHLRLPWDRCSLIEKFEFEGEHHLARERWQCRQSEPRGPKGEERHDRLRELERVSADSR